MYEYRQIILQMRVGASDRQLEREKLISRGKAKQLRAIAIEKGWLDKDHLLPDDEELAKTLLKNSAQKKLDTKLKPFHEQISKWVDQGISAKIIHRVLSEQYSFEGSYDCVRRIVQNIKKQNPTVTMILQFNPGECAQVDFGQGPKLYDCGSKKIVKTWFFIMTLCWSRHQYVEIIKNQTVETWLGCHRRAFEWFNGVPKKIIIDNPKCAITKACYYEPTVQRSYYEFAEAYGFVVSPCPVADPKKKGQVEAGVKYVKRNFLPLKDLRSISNANQEVKIWILEVAGNRTHGSTFTKPLTRFKETEQLLLQPLPEVAPEWSVWEKVLVYRDCHIRFQKCKYSVPYDLVGKSLWCRTTETNIRLYKDHILVAVHNRLSTPGLNSTLADHLPLKMQAYLSHDAQWCLENAQTIGSYCLQVISNLLNNKVVDYLRCAQGIIKLRDKYGSERLELACRRSITYETATYQSIKTILKKGLEQENYSQEDAFDQLSNVYLGHSKFCRPKKDLIH